MDGDKRLRKVSQKTGDRRSVHIVATEEQAAYADWINNNLAGDKDVEHKLKLDETGSDLYEKLDDGVILCKIVNLAVPGTIKTKKINKGKNISIWKQHENLNLALNAMKSIGCIVVGIDSHTLMSSQGKKWLVLGLIWQLLKIYLFNQILNANKAPEKISGASKAPKVLPEQEIIRWVNTNLEKVNLYFKDLHA